MNRTQCPHCGELHNYRDSSAGMQTRCVSCGNNYRLPAVQAVQRSTRKWYSTCLGCLGLLTFGGILIAFTSRGLHHEADKTSQDSGFKEQEREEQKKDNSNKNKRQSGSIAMNLAEQGKTQQEKRKAEDPAEIKQRADAEARQKPAQKAKEEAKRDAARKAELEEKGLPYYPPPRTLESGHNAEEWYRLLRDNPQDARIYKQADAAFSALKEEGIPFLLDYLSLQSTPKSRYDALRLIQVEYVHRNDLHKLLPCLEQSKNYQSTRLLALQGLEMRAKDLNKDLVPKIESLVEDILNNRRLTEKTQEEIKSRLKTIRLEANSPAANGQH